MTETATELLSDVEFRRMVDALRYGRPMLAKRIEAERAARIAAEAKLAAVEAERDRALRLVDGALSIFDQCAVEAGYCCCGDDMKNHSSPVSCGHSPVDQGEYAVNCWREEYAALTAPAGGERNEGDT